MQTMRDLINKIKWDKRENPDNNSVGYLDRVSNKIIKIDFNEIIRVEGSFMVLDRVEETEIPLHKIKEVRRKGEVIWKR